MSLAVAVAAASPPMRMPRWRMVLVVLTYWMLVAVSVKPAVMALAPNVIPLVLEILMRSPEAAQNGITA